MKVKGTSGLGMMHLAVRALLTPFYGLAAFGTASAYSYFVVGAIAGVEGVAKGRYFLGPLLSILSVTGAFALWRVWLIGGRMWRDGSYDKASSEDRRYDAAGLIAAVAAFVGLAAIASSIHRGAEVMFFGILLGPAVALASLVFISNLPWLPRVPTGAEPDRAQVISFRSTFKLADLPGILCGTALGLLGIQYLVPRPQSGWGPCDWSVFYPLYQELWPRQRLEVFDACNGGVGSLSVIGLVLMLVCVITGAVAAAIGRTANAARGAWAVAIVIVITLAQLLIQKMGTPVAPYVGWIESLVAGVFIAAGATWLGYVGGLCGMRWRPDNR
jgi:hypothetical protein